MRQWLANNTFKPAKASGPILFLDSHKAWLNPNARQKKQKKLSAKEWRQLAQFYRNSLDQVGDEHVKLAEDADREPRVWNQIVLERAKIEAEFSETAGDLEFPVTATRPEGVDDEQGAAQEAVGAVLLEEHADFDDAVQPQELPSGKQTVPRCGFHRSRQNPYSAASPTATAEASATFATLRCAGTGYRW